MTFDQLIHHRRSVRAYTDEPVPDAVIRQCLETARLAPSACNAQPWHFVVVTDPQRRRSLARCSVPPGGVMNTFVEQAPVLIALVGERPNITSQVGALLKRKPFYLIDLGIAAEHFCLQAAELGLGTCMIGWFSERETHRLLGIPRTRRPVLLITLGYAVDEPATKRSGASVAADTSDTSGAREAPPPKRRKDLATIASRDSYGTPWEA